MIVFNLSTASTAYSQDQVGEKCAELAVESGAVCSAEKEAISKIPESSENNEATMTIRSNYKACMKGFVRDCRIKFSK